MRFPHAVAAAIATAGLLAAAPAASAAPALDPATGFAPSAQPKKIVAGPDGNVWFTLPGGAVAKEFGKIAPDGTITEFEIPGNPFPGAIGTAPSATGAAHDRIWIAYDQGVYIFDPAAGTGTAHAIATLGQSDGGLAADGDGNVWVKEANGDDLVKIAPNGTKIADVDTAGLTGRGAALGSDGRIWWSDPNGKAVHATETAGPAYTTTPYPVGGGVGPQGIVAGPAGQLGFSNPGNEVGTITTGGVANQVTDVGSDAFGVTYAADGAYWYPLFASNQVGRLTTDGQFTKPINLPAGSGPRYIAAGPNNTVWVTGEQDSKIYRITGVEPAPAPQTGGDTGGQTGGDGGPATPADTVAPALSGAKVNALRRKLSIQLSEAATVEVVVQQKRTRRNGKRYWKSVRKFPAAQVQAGRNSISLGKRRFSRGAHRVVLTAKDAAGNASRKSVGFRVR